MEDPRGILRGSCNAPHCDCPGYTRSDKSVIKCLVCLHPPGVHDRLQPLPATRKSSFTKRSKRDVFEKSHSRRIKGGVPKVSEIPVAPIMSGKVPETVLGRPSGRFEKSPAKSASSSYHYQAELNDFQQLQQDPSTFSVMRQHAHFPSMHVAGPNVTDYFGTPVDLTDLDGTRFERTFDQSTNMPELPSAVTGRMQTWPSTQEAISPDFLCIGCHKRKKFQKMDGTYYDYCGNTCRNLHHRNNSQVLGGSHPSCVGCGRPCYMREDGTYYDYCGSGCRDAHLSKPKMVLPYGIDGGTSACNVSITRYDGADCRRQFQRMWAPQKGACPSVKHIFLVTNSILQQQFDFYKQNSKVMKVEHHFHGTSLKCDLTRNNTLCIDRSCGICGISRYGFGSNLIGSNVSFQRFGQGFYLAPHSSKCHDYTQGCEVSGYRAMLLCEVCPGNKYRTKKTNQSLRSPPRGCDCVYGETGQDLNYPEIVLYNQHSILPKLIILYKKDGIHKLV